MKLSPRCQKISELWLNGKQEDLKEKRRERERERQRAKNKKKWKTKLETKLNKEIACGILHCYLFSVFKVNRKSHRRIKTKTAFILPFSFCFSSFLLHSISVYFCTPFFFRSAKQIEYVCSLYEKRQEKGQRIKRRK